MNVIETPIGKICVEIDSQESQYQIKQIQNSKHCPDVVGRYHLICHLDSEADHVIRCFVLGENIKSTDIESGELFECLSFYSYDNFKLSIGMEFDSENDKYDFEMAYLKNGFELNVPKGSKTNEYKFGVAWINDVSEGNERGLQTWFAADVTID